MISYMCFYKRSNKQVRKGSILKNIKNAIKEYKKTLEKGLIKKLYFRSNF